MAYFYKMNSNFKVKGLSMGDTLLELSRLTVIANLPSKDEAIAQLAGILNAPLNKLVSLVNEIPTKFVRILEVIRQSKQEADS